MVLNSPNVLKRRVFVARVRARSDPVFNSGVTCVLKHARLSLALRTAPRLTAPLYKLNQTTLQIANGN